MQLEMQFDQDAHSEVQHQLLITLVHGTWPQGFFRTFFWMPRRRHPSPLWYEDGSPFLARLSTELHDISHKMRRLRWTGANSIRIRDETAQVLAEHLSVEHAEHPQATQLVIAHSHGGNIALRALHHLKQRDASQSSAEPLVVTLATPFVEVHHADLGVFRPFYFRGALVIIISSVAWAGLSYISGFLPALPVPFGNGLSTIAIGVLAGFLGWLWLDKRKPVRQSKLDALKDATQIGALTPAYRLLVVRAIDDEASLTMALGTIFSYATVTSIAYIYAVYFGVLEISLLLKLWSSWVPELTNSGYVIIMFLLTVLFIMFMVSRTVHGRELARSPVECQINTQSTPDAVSLPKIVTLVRRKYVKSLRHGIYGHEDCPKVISDWVRLRLETN
jgi:hypothetical protein